MSRKKNRINSRKQKPPSPAIDKPSQAMADTEVSVKQSERSKDSTLEAAKIGAKFSIIGTIIGVTIASFFGYLQKREDRNAERIDRRFEARNETFKELSYECARYHRLREKALAYAFTLESLNGGSRRSDTLEQKRKLEDTARAFLPEEYEDAKECAEAHSKVIGLLKVAEISFGPLTKREIGRYEAYIAQSPEEYKRAFNSGKAESQTAKVDPYEISKQIRGVMDRNLGELLTAMYREMGPSE